MTKSLANSFGPSSRRFGSRSWDGTRKRIVELEKSLAVADARLEAVEARSIAAESEHDYLRPGTRHRADCHPAVLPERAESTGGSPCSRLSHRSRHPCGEERM
jgi:hypothetical protein